MYTSLKDRELEILELMAERLSNREIAERLTIGVETVRWYARHIYSKLHVSGRREAVAKAIELEILNQSGENSSEIVDTYHNNLPQRLSSFVGRQSHLDAVLKLIQQHRLITLLGTGGTGKTRLSIEIANHAQNIFTDGIYFVDLTKITDVDDIPTVIAESLGLTGKMDDIVAHIIHFLSSKQILLLLDNVEHVVDGSAIVGDLLSKSKHLTVLTTSREVLNLEGEYVYHVPPLSLDATFLGIASEAVELFVQRAQQQRATFQLTDANRDDIQTICQLVDGLPLAIELLSVHVRLFSPKQLREKLAQHMAIPSSRQRNIPERHRNLTNTIDWSYQLLSKREQRLFVQLSVFQSGASLAAIQAIYDDTENLFDDLSALLDKSMILQIDDVMNEPRFIMLMTLQAYAREKLERMDDYRAVQSRHARYFMGLVEQAVLHLRSQNQSWWFRKLDLEYNNLTKAMSWSLAGYEPETGVRLVAGLRDYWWYQGIADKSWRWVQAAMEYQDDVDASYRANLYLTAGNLAYFRGDKQSCRAYGALALSTYQSLGDRRGIAWSSNFPAIDVGNALDVRIQANRKTIALMRDIDDMSGLTNMLNVLGLLLTEAQAYDEAVEAFEECLDISRQIKEVRREAIVIGCLAEIALLRQQYDKAIKLFYESFDLGKRLEFPFHMHDLFWMCIVLLVEIKQINAAMVLFGAARAREHSTGQSIFPFQTQYLILPFDHLDTLRQDDRGLQQAYDTGYMLSLNEAVDYALDVLNDLSSSV